MSDGNNKHNCKIYESFYNKLLKHYDRLLKAKNQRHIIEIIKDYSIKLIDSTVIRLCLLMFDWAKFRTSKGELKYTLVGMMHYKFLI